MFHIVYSRHYWDTEDQGQFTNTWTIYRSVPYSQLSEMQKAIPSLLKNADEVYTAYQAKIIQMFQMRISHIQKFM